MVGSMSHPETEIDGRITPPPSWSDNGAYGGNLKPVCCSVRWHRQETSNYDETGHDVHIPSGERAERRENTPNAAELLLSVHVSLKVARRRLSVTTPVAWQHFLAVEL